MRRHRHFSWREDVGISVKEYWYEEDRPYVVSGPNGAAWMRPGHLNRKYIDLSSGAEITSDQAHARKSEFLNSVSLDRHGYVLLDEQGNPICRSGGEK